MAGGTFYRGLYAEFYQQGEVSSHFTITGHSILDMLYILSLAESMWTLIQAQRKLLSPPQLNRRNEDEISTQKNTLYQLLI